VNALTKFNTVSLVVCVCSVCYATLLALADVRYKELRATFNVHARKKRKEKDRERIELACFGPFCVTKKVYIYIYISVGGKVGARQ
jgi:hypothetical protein